MFWSGVSVPLQLGLPDTVPPQYGALREVSIHTARARLGSQRCGRGCGLDGHHRRMAAPHLVLSGAVSHRLSDDLDSPPASGPQTYRGPSTAERPAAPGRGPSWLQATCSRRASGRRGDCGRGSSGTPAWQGEALIRKETKPPAQPEGPSPFLAS